MDNELFEVKQEVTKDSLDLLSKLCTELKNIDQEIQLRENQLKEAKNRHEGVSRGKIPALFNELQLSKLSLQSGETVEVSDKLKASIADKNHLLAYRNMITAEAETGCDEDTANNKIEALFKSEVIISDPSDEIIDILLDNDVEYSVKRSIHWQTLNRYCSDRLDQGLTIPEGISVFQYQETKIK